LYFVAKGDGSRTHAFAKTLPEHEANLEKYGYR
jgi:cell division protein YceG involved in septum cleavage